MVEFLDRMCAEPTFIVYYQLQNNAIQVSDKVLTEKSMEVFLHHRVDTDIKTLQSLAKLMLIL